MSNHNEFWILNGWDRKNHITTIASLVCEQSKSAEGNDEYVRYIEKAAYDKAVEALKKISNSDNEVSRWATRCLRDLGEEYFKSFPHIKVRWEGADSRCKQTQCGVGYD